MDVSYTEKGNLKRMIQYSLESEKGANKNVLWSHNMNFSFLFEYNEGSLIEIKRARDGLENEPQYITHFYITYKNSLPDSIVEKDHLARLRTVAYFNGKKDVDSTYNYSYTIPKGIVFFQSK